MLKMKSVIILSVIIIFISMFLSINYFSQQSISDYYIINSPEIKSPNVVSAILWDFRSYDTLGEEIVLFSSAMGVLVIWGVVCRKKL